MVASRPSARTAPPFRRLALALSLAVPSPCRRSPRPRRRLLARNRRASWPASRDRLSYHQDVGSSCRYEAQPGPPSVRLELGAGSRSRARSRSTGPPPRGGVPALRTRHRSPSSRARGPRSRSPTRRQRVDAVLPGERRGPARAPSWRQGGAEEPLAEGVLAAGWPVAHRKAERRGAAQARGQGGAAVAAPTLAPSVREAGRQHRRHHRRERRRAGPLYGANKLGKGSSESGVIARLPLTRIVGAPNEPCFCEGNVVSGASCGTTRRDHPSARSANGRDVPCQSGLSCNSGLCEDRFGRCPY